MVTACLRFYFQVPVLVANCPEYRGFVGNRMLYPRGLEVGNLACILLGTLSHNAVVLKEMFSEIYVLKYNLTD